MGSYYDPDKTRLNDLPYFDVLEKSIWANYRSVSGNEHYTSVLVDYATECIFTVNYHKEIRAGMFVLYMNKVYKIVYVDDLEGHRRDMQVHCTGSWKLNKEIVEASKEIRERLINGETTDGAADGREGE